MKKILCLFLSVALLFCFAACADEADKGEVYYFHQLTADGVTVTASELAAQTQADGVKLNDVYYLKLFKDGTGILCDMGVENTMKRDATHIWHADDENTKMPFTIDGDQITIQDGDASVVFKKN